MLLFLTSVGCPMHLFLELEVTSVSPLSVSLVLQEYYQKMSVDWFNPSQAQHYSILDRKKVQNNQVLKCHNHHLKYITTNCPTGKEKWHIPHLNCRNIS